MLDAFRKILGTKKVFESPFFTINQRQISMQGRPPEDYFILEGSGRIVNVLGIDDENQVYLVEQYRFAIDRMTVDLPGGNVDEGESYEDAARREFEEETGYVLGPVKPLVSTYADSGRLNMERRIFSGRVTGKSPRDFDSHETYRLHRIPFPDLHSGVMSGSYVEPSVMIAALLFSSRQPGV